MLPGANGVVAFAQSPHSTINALEVKTLRILRYNQTSVNRAASVCLMTLLLTSLLQCLAFGDRPSGHQCKPDPLRGSTRKYICKEVDNQPDDISDPVSLWSVTLDGSELKPGDEPDSKQFTYTPHKMFHFHWPIKWDNSKSRGPMSRIWMRESPSCNQCMFLRTSSKPIEKIVEARPCYYTNVTLWEQSITRSYNVHITELVVPICSCKKTLPPELNGYGTCKAEEYQTKRWDTARDTKAK